MKKITCLLMAVCMILVWAPCLGEDLSNNFLDLNDQQRLMILGQDMFSRTINSIETDLLSIGYHESNANTMGKALGFFAAYTSSEIQPIEFAFNYGADKKPTQISITYSRDSNAYMVLKQNLIDLLGEPTKQEEYKEKQNGYTLTHKEALKWYGKEFTAQIHCPGNGITTTIAEIESGKSDFILQLTLGENRTAAIVAPTNTPKPTIRPTPMKLDVSVYSISGDRNSIGTTEIYVQFWNNHASKSIDRIDFIVKCYDTYGSLIKGNGVYDNAACYYDDTTLKPGKATSNNIRWTLYGFDGTKKIEIAINKYHFVSGETVEVPDHLLSWESYNVY